jgi:hypothetical protein
MNGDGEQVELTFCNAVDESGTSLLVRIANSLL